MSDRPAIPAALVATLTAAVPARLVKKLDGNPKLAASWTWSVDHDACRVTTDTGETVSLSLRDGIVPDAPSVQCSCLLSPRCLHVLAVVTTLPVAGEATPAAVPSAPPLPSAGEGPGARVQQTSWSSAQRAIADQALHVSADILRAGSAHTGAVLQAELLRVAHAARAEGLHRLGAAAVRTVAGIRSLRSDEAGFTLEAYTGDLQDLLATAHHLARAGAGVDATWIGVARRPYEAVGHLHLAGLCAEPVISSRGYAGVVTALCDQHGRVWTVSDVLPGSPSRAIDAFEAPAAIGDATLPHRELSREGLFVQDATGSADGRLGSGAGVRAVRSRTAATWDEGGIARRFAEPWAAQLDRAYGALDVPLAQRPRGDGLLFLRARVLGIERDALWCAVRDAELEVRLVVAGDHPSLAYRDNLRMLGRAPGMPVRVVGALSADAPRTLGALAIAPDVPWEDAPDAPRLVVPEAWRGRVNLGYESLQSANIEPVRATPIEVVVAEAGSPERALLEPLLRWRDRVAMHGLEGLPTSARGRVDADRKKLAARAMPTAARWLGALADACGSRAAPVALAQAWLGASVHLEVAGRALARSGWE